MTLDDSILPDWSLLNPAYFKKHPSKPWSDHVKSMHLLSSRGCPYHCIFCTNIAMWHGKIRFHSAEYVVGMVSELANTHGITRFILEDDLFAVNPHRLRRIAELLSAEGLLDKVRFYCSLRANLVDDKLCELLASLNVKIVFFGFESGNERRGRSF